MPTVQQWLWYWLQLPGCPFGSRPDQADVIVVPAFGRNTLTDDDLPELRQYHDSEGGDDLTTLQVCWDHRLNVGDPNRSLGLRLIAAAHTYQLPIIAQWEVIAACPPDWYRRHRQRITCLWPPPTPNGGYNSLAVLNDMLRVMRANGWDQPLLLAQTYHAMRFGALIRKKLGAWPAILNDLPDDFDWGSVQWQTRSRVAWAHYQVLACTHHVLHRLV